MVTVCDGLLQSTLYTAILCIVVTQLLYTPTVMDYIAQEVTLLGDPLPAHRQNPCTMVVNATLKAMYQLVHYQPQCSNCPSLQMMWTLVMWAHLPWALRLHTQRAGFTPCWWVEVGPWQCLGEACQACSTGQSMVSKCLTSNLTAIW